MWWLIAERPPEGGTDSEEYLERNYLRVRHTEIAYGPLMRDNHTDCIVGLQFKWMQPGITKFFQSHYGLLSTGHATHSNLCEVKVHTHFRQTKGMSIGPGHVSGRQWNQRLLLHRQDFLLGTPWPSWVVRYNLLDLHYRCSVPANYDIFNARCWWLVTHDSLDLMWV